MSYSFLKKLKALSPRTNVNSYIRGIILFGIITYLTYQLSQIGWSNIIGSIPESPWFYILSLAAFITPVIAEIASFKITSENKISAPLRLFVRKHVLNKAVLAYSGEAYLVHELSQHNGLTVKKAATIIKDLALVRTFVANLWVIILVLAALILGNAATLEKITLTSPALIISVGLICLLVCAGTVVFFKKLTKLPYALGAKISGIFLFRSFIVASILTAQWSLAIPGIPLSVWFIFLVVFSLTRKSPVGGEMVFIGVALALPGLGGGSAEIAAMLLTILALNQVNYLLAFLMTSDFTGLVKTTSSSKLISSKVT